MNILSVHRDHCFVVVPKLWVILLLVAHFAVAALASSAEAEAALFLEQATWGPTPKSIERVLSVGKQAFLEEQLSQPAVLYPAPADAKVVMTPYQQLFFRNAVHGNDQLRQRTAFALSQILVVSANSLNRGHQMVPYLNILAEGAFGNYKDLLLNISLNPAMGRFLDNVNNVKANPAQGTSANENYSREFLQLFTVGTELLNDDGSKVLDADGNPVPVYTEDTVKDLAKAFTGWRWAPTPGRQDRRPNNRAYYGAPMVPWDPFHDTTEKTLLNGYQMPAGRTTLEDLTDAIGHIFDHPNVGPFISIRLIRALVTSNPSPEYVRHVVATFNNNGAGVKGDMKAVLRAILSHPEASAPLRLTGTMGSSQGHLTEPALFVVKMMRALDATVTDANKLNRFSTLMGQSVFFPPSVFSYYLLDHQLSAVELAAPEFELHTSATSIERANFVGMVVDRRLGNGVSYRFDELAALAADPVRLIDELSLRLTHDTLPPEAKTVVKNFVTGTDDAGFRVNRALYLVANSPQSWTSGARRPVVTLRSVGGRRRASLQ